MGHLFTSIHLDWIHLTRSSLDEVKQNVKFDTISDHYYHKTNVQRCFSCFKTDLFLTKAFTICTLNNKFTLIVKLSMSKKQAKVTDETL